MSDPPSYAPDVERRLRRHVSVLRALRELSHVVPANDEPAFILERACALLVESTGVDSCVIMALPGAQPKIVAAAGNQAKCEILRAMCAARQAPPCALSALAEHRAVVQHVGESECASCGVAAAFPGPRDTIAVPFPGCDQAANVLIVALPPDVRADDAERGLMVDVVGDLCGMLEVVQARSTLLRLYQTSEQEFRTIFELSPIGKSLTAPDGRLLRVNQAFADLLGYEVEWLLARGFQDITPVEDLPASRELVRRLLAGESDTATIEKRYLHRDGHAVWALVCTRLLRDPGGKPVYFVTTVQDISERKRVEAELTEREERLRLLFETMPVGWAEHRMILDLEGRPADYEFLRVNAAFERFTGLDRKMIIGKRVTEVIPGIRCAEPDLVSLYGEVTLTGKLRKLEVNFAPLGRWYGLTAFRRCEGEFVVVFEDITARKGAEDDERVLNESLRRANEDLAVANKEIEAFAYSVSHDLRQPLRGLDGFSRLLVDRYADALDPTAQDYLHRIRASAVRMGSLIDDLLRLSRITRAQMRPEWVDLAPIAVEISTHLSAEEPGRSVAWEIAPGLRARGDRQLLRVALENLLGNAWKYTARKAAARIEVGALERAQDMVFFVRDDGAGFDMRYVDKLFGAFQRLHGEAEFPGSGIGLATVQRIVHRHGGRIWAEAEVDKGATFFFTLAPSGAHDPQVDPGHVANAAATARRGEQP